MPRVERAQRRVQEAGLPGIGQGPRATPTEFGADRFADIGRLGGAIGQLGAGLARGEKRGEDKVNRAAAREQLVSATDEWRKKLVEFNSKKGKDALELGSEADQFNKELRDRYVENLSDPQQRDYFTASYDSAASSYLDQIYKRQGKEAEQYDNDTLDAENLGLVQDAVANEEPGAIKNVEALIVANTRVKSGRLGDSPELKQKRVDEATHNLYSTKLASLTSKSPLVAQEFMEENWDKFNPLVREQMKEKLEGMAAKEWADVKAQEILAEPKPLDQQLKEAEDIKDPERREDVKRIIKDTNNEQQEVNQIKEKEVLDSQVKDVLTDPDNYQIPKNVSPDNHLRLYKLQRMAKQDARADRGAGKRPQTNPEAYDKLDRLSSAQLRDTNLLDYVNRGELSMADYKHFRDRQRDEGMHEASQTKSAYVSQFIVSEGLEKPKNFARAAHLRASFDNELNKYPKDEREKIETWNKVKDTLILEVDVAGSFFDSKYYEARYAGDQILEPEDKPDQVPANAQWIDRMHADGTIYRGYEFVNPQGIKTLYSIDGNIYRVDG